MQLVLSVKVSVRRVQQSPVSIASLDEPGLAADGHRVMNDLSPGLLQKGKYIDSGRGERI